MQSGPIKILQHNCNNNKLYGENKKIKKLDLEIPFYLPDD